MRLSPSQACAIAFALSLCVAAPAMAQMYKSKDARGVTRYSDAPPAKGKYTTVEAPRQVAPAPARPTGPATAAAAAPADPRCDTARRNLAMLQDTGPVQMAGADGKPGRALSATERTSELEMARSTLKAYNCSDAVVRPAPAAAGGATT